MKTFRNLLSQANSFVSKAINSYQKHSSEHHSELEVLDQHIDHAEKKTQETSSIRISRSSLMRFWIYGFGIVILAWIAYFLKDLIYLFSIAFIIAVATETFICFFSKWVPRSLSIGISYLLMSIFLLSGVLVLIPFMVQQSSEIGTMIVDEVKIIQDDMQSQGIEGYIQQSRLPQPVKSSLISLVEQKNIKETIQNGIMSNASQIASLGSNYLGNAGGWVVSFLAGFFKILAQIGVVFIVAIFISIEKDSVTQVLASLSGNVAYTKLKIQKLYKKLGYRLEGQLILSLYIFAMVYVGLWILAIFGIDLPNKFTLAIIAGLFEFLPYIGPGLAGLAGILVAFLAFGWKAMLITRVMYWVVQWTENNILIPAVMSKTIGVSPMLILLCAISGVTLFGILGVLLAVPLAVMIMILFEDLIEKPGT